jgi:hypothetical protein
MHTDPIPFTFESVQRAMTDLSARHEELRFRLSALLEAQVAADVEHRARLALAYEATRERRLNAAQADAAARADLDVLDAAERLANARNAIEDVKLTIEHVQAYRYDLRALVEWKASGSRV